MPDPLQRRACLFALLGAAGTGGAAEEQPQTLTLQLPGVIIELIVEPGFAPALLAQALDWVRRGVAAVSGYFGRFPLQRLEMQLHRVAGAGVVSGTTFDDPAPWIRVRLGERTTAAQLRQDWVLVHEMVHLAVPRVPRGQAWLHEGIATYVEAVARGRAGLVEPRSVWRDWQLRMPQGQPQPGDRGLDHTPGWARTYWGGALFCLLADVRLLQASGLRHGLRDALRGVLDAGGSYAVAWPAARILAAADAAVGGDTLLALYEAMKDRPLRVDLEALWRELGVDGDTLHDDAPAAAVRRAILV